MTLVLHEDRYFDADPAIRQIARELYATVKDLPIISPHGHTDPRWFADNQPFQDPAELIVIPDHYIFRMLYSAGISLEALGIPARDGTPVEQDRRKIWQIFADNFYLFRGTPTSIWLKHVLADVFSIDQELNKHSAQEIYDRISGKLGRPEYRPRALFERFGIEVLSTTESAADPLVSHSKIRTSDWKGRVVPCFRPDAVVNHCHTQAWRASITELAKASGQEIGGYKDYITVMETRRMFFKSMGATSTDHAVLVPYTQALSTQEVETLFQRALLSQATEEDAERFTAHMLMEFARMSIEDGLVMQLHSGSWRNHNDALMHRFGPDMGGDIPVATEYARNLHALLNRYGNDSRLALILFTLDESTYARELAPLAGHYPAVKIGPPWWFHDSIAGMIRFKQRVYETAGIYNTVGFNDDTRAFPSIPARHDLARRIDANFLAGLVSRHIVTLEEARDMVIALAYRLAKEAYRL